MATHPAQPPVPGTPPAAGAPQKPPDAHYDEMSGVYGFFRRHQKKLLYTAGLFTLLTFSITGPVMALFGNVFGGARAMPTIEVGGRRVELQPEDYDYGRVLSSRRNALPQGVLPPLHAGEGNENQLLDVLAILRRAAIEEGIEPSMTEVDKAIEAERERWKTESAARMARDRGYESLAHFRMTVAEAMRIGTYVRLQTLALDDTDARVLHYVTSDREKITLRVASFDEKKAEETLKQGKTLTEEELRTWVEGKNDRDKQVMQAFDLPRAQLRFGALLLAEFDPEQWKDGYLKDFTISDDQLKNVYNVERETRFKPDGATEPKPLDDEAVKAEVTKIVQAEHVMNQLLAALRSKQSETIKPQTDEQASAQSELGAAETSLRELEQKAAEQKAIVDAKQQELTAKPDDETVRTALATAKSELEATENARFQAKEKVPALQAAVKTADEAIKAARVAFDLAAAFAELTKDKKGAVTKAMTELKNADEMKDLDAPGLELGLGKWPTSVQGSSVRAAGDLGYAPFRTSKAVIVYQAIATEPRPMKPWDKLKPIAEGAYWTEQAKTLGEEKKKAMEDALLRLAKDEMKERVAELEGQKQKRVDDKLAEWETKTRAALEKAEKESGRLPPGSRVRDLWQQELERCRTEIAQKEQRRTALEAEVAKAITDEIAAEAKKHYKAVLDRAAAEAGFTVADLGPFPRDLAEREPRFDKAFDPPVVFLWRSQSKLKEGEATGLLQDTTNRAWHVAVCTKVEPLSPDDVSRRDFESLRTGNGNRTFASTQALYAYATAFTLKAVEQRYALQRPGEAREQSATNK
jgi:hypothetical protein